MSNPELPLKPLVEAIFEIRWMLKQSDANPTIRTDPNYKLLPGRIFDRLTGAHNLTKHEQLPQADLPEELTPYHVHHRFRNAANDWPLVQVGPGIFTVNDTDTYKWESFLNLCLSTTGVFFDSYPKDSKLEFHSLVLRYIDAIEIRESDPADVLQFLKEHLNTTVALPKTLFEENAQTEPSSFKAQMVYPISSPNGTILLSFSSGMKGKAPALIIETIISTPGAQLEKYDIKPDGDGLKTWLEEAHNLSSSWFHTLTAGELNRRFMGDE